MERVHPGSTGEIRIAPSVLSADFGSLAGAVTAVNDETDWLHVDVMDGHFVPNITIGPPVVKAIKRVATTPLDVHLMIEAPDRYIEAFVAAGASMVSVHVEAVPHLHRTLGFIRKLGAKAEDTACTLDGRPSAALARSPGPLGGKLHGP